MPVIHIGFPRTATTTLQRAVFAKHPEIHYLGKPFRRQNPTEDRRTRLPAEVITAVWSQDSLGFDAEATKGELDSAFQTEAAAGKTVVLSEEALSMAGFADRRLIAERLRKLFGPSDILITIRNQETVLPSLYLHYLRKGLVARTPFDAWFANACAPNDFVDRSDAWMVAQYRYCELYSLYRTVFPENRIKVLAYEKMAADPTAFCAELSAFLEIGPIETGRLLSQAEVSNRALPRNLVRRGNAYRSMERIYGRLRKRISPGLALRHQMPALWNLKERARSQALQSSSTAHRGSDREPISEGARNLIHAYYADENRRLAEATGLPLKEYGYPL